MQRDQRRWAARHQVAAQESQLRRDMAELETDAKHCTFQPAAHSAAGPFDVTSSDFTRSTLSTNPRWLRRRLDDTLLAEERERSSGPCANRSHRSPSPTTDAGAVFSRLSVTPRASETRGSESSPRKKRPAPSPTKNWY
jgi:hypothetical protein